MMDEFRIIEPNRKDHRIPVSELITMQWDTMSNRIRDAHHDWSTSRIGLIGDTVVTLWAVFDISMRIGSATVRTAAIDCVTTHPEYRKRGLMTQTARAALDAMRANGYVVSLLNGINDYYNRFGYATVWPQWHYTVPTDALPASRPAYMLEEYTPDHRDDLAEIYNRENAVNTGTAVRPTYQKAKWPGFYTGYLWKDDDGNPLGYLVGDQAPEEKDQTFWCKDAAGDPEQILELAGVLTRQWGYKEILFERLHYNSRLARHLRRIGCRSEAFYKRSGDFMLAILDLQALFASLTDTLSRRLRQSHMASWTGDLTIASASESVTLTIDKGDVKLGNGRTAPHAIRGDAALAKLIMGTDDPEVIADQEGIELTGDAAQLIGVLFPPQFPQIAAVDI